MERRVQLTAAMGLGLMLASVSGYVGLQRWMSTRIVHPVDMPVSLAVGHVHTGPFRLNLSTRYMVIPSPNTDWHWDSAHPECEPYRHLLTRWVLYQNGKVIDRLDQPIVLPWPSYFSATPGLYDLDLEVMSDFSCLDPVHPHLKIIAMTENYESVVFAARVALTIGVYVGFVVLTFVPVVRFVYSFERCDRVTESASVGQDFQWARRLPQRCPFSGLPAFGLFGGMMFAVLAILMMLLTAFTAPPTPTGLWVRVLKMGDAAAKSDAWTEKPLIVLLKDPGPGQEPKLYVNSKQVGWDDLAGVLKQELGQRSQWTVYVGADDCLPWDNVAFVIDAARGLHAKVFLITGGKRKPCGQPRGLPVTM